MGYALAGLAVAAIGAGASAYGTSENAQAVGDMAQFNIALSDKFAKRQTQKAQDLIDAKTERLYNSGDIFQRYESTGAFGGNLDVLDNLRQAQSDFSKLAAGDFSGFESQLDRIMKDNLVSTFGAGAPIGSYTGLSADSIMNLRQQGLSTAQQTTGFLSDLTNNLLGVEFGVMDQGFNLQYQIDKDKVNAIMGYGMQGAQTEGVGMQAAGNALQQVGSSIFSYGMYNNNNLNAQVANAPRAGNPYSTPVNGYYQPYGYSTPAPIATAAPAYPSVYPQSYNPNYTPPSYASSSPRSAGGYGDLPTFGLDVNPNAVDKYGVLPSYVNGSTAYGSNQGSIVPVNFSPGAYGFETLVSPALNIIR